jgi:hypothetical protein
LKQILNKEVYNNTFIGLDIHQYIETNDLQYTHHLINNKHNIHIFTNVNEKSPDINKIAEIIGFMENLARTYNLGLPPVKLTILYSNQKKRIDYNTDVINSRHVNSGSTYPGLSIFCWRKEELFKVLIHELFHYYKFDFSRNDVYYPILEDRINSNFVKINGIDMINESYTETMTILILNIYLSILENKNNTYEKIIEKTRNKIKTEISFLMYQVSKLIYISGGESYGDILNNNITINQTTSVRSYYLFKLLLLSNLDELLYNLDSLQINNDKLIVFCEKLIKSNNNFSPNNIVIIDKFINYYKENKNNNSWINKTFRMSVYG